MPFFDDSGARPEGERHPVWRALALAREQLERVILLNLLWAAQVAPLLLAWALPNLSVAARAALALYTAFAILPATGMMFAVLDALSDGTPLNGELIWESLRTQFAPSFLKLFPLCSLFGWLAWGASFAAAQNWLLLDVLARLAFLLLAVFSLYWGPLMVARPGLSAWGIFVQAAQWTWRKPAPTLLTGLACLFALALGVISLGGFFLIAPALIALMQVELYRSLARAQHG
jgi:hypothetical protein